MHEPGTVEEQNEQRNWWNRLWDRRYGEFDDDDDDDGFGVEPPAVGRGRSAGTLLHVSASRGSQITKRRPTTLEDAQRAAEDLKERRPVIVNLEGADDVMARRVIDFISGVTYALNGYYDRIGETVFLFTTANIVIADEDELAQSGKAPFVHHP